MTETTPLPRHISRYGNGYIIRVRRNNVTHRAVRPNLDSALTARAELLEQVGSPRTGRPAGDNPWPRQFAAQFAARPHADMTGVHIRARGLHVSLRRDGVLHDGGYHSGEDALAKALAARDRLRDGLPV